MKKTIVLICGMIVFGTAYGQEKKDVWLAFHTDLIKSNASGYFGRAQVSLETNYFITTKLAPTLGVEYWSTGNQISLVVGGRWFPVPDAFVRARALWGANVFSLGGGWAKPLNPRWKFEAIGDVYTGGNIAIRAGLIYKIMASP